MNVLVDGRTFTKKSAGISTFLKCSLQEWANKSPQNNFWVFVPKKKDETISFSCFPANVHFINIQFYGFIPNLFLLLLCIPYYIRKYKIDLYYSPVPCIPYFLPKRVKKLIVVHDVVNIAYKDTMQLRNKIANSLLFERSIINADYLWTNSEYTKLQVEKYFRERKCRNIFVGCSVDDNIFKRNVISKEKHQQILKRIGINHRFILFVGTLEPRKNLSFLLSLMPKLYKDYKLQLVIVGARGWKDSNIFDIVNNPTYPKDSTIFCGYVSNDDLACLYDMAACFVSTSLNEGFGMPQLEALKCGCPVLTSHNSAMIEVVSDIEGGHTIEGYETEAWIDAILKIVNNPRFVKGEKLSTYNWEYIINGLMYYLS